MPAVSVVLPTYNRADVLPRAIDSVLNQTFTDYELIVIDDGSAEDIETVVERFDDDRIRFCSHDENRGGSAARNTGIELAEGDYIAFLDSDDEWYPHKLEKQVAELESRPDTWVAVYCDTDKVDNRQSTNVDLIFEIVNRIVPNEEKDKNNKKPEGGEELMRPLLMMDFSIGGASTLLVESETVNKIGGFDERFPRHQDWEFLIRVLEQGKLAYIDEELVIKHSTGRAPVNMTRKAKTLYFKKFSDYIEQFENEGYDITGVHSFDLALLTFKEGEFKRGTEYLIDSRVDGYYVPLLRAILTGIENKLTNTHVRE